MAPAHVLRGDVPGALLDPPHQGELDVRPLVDGHGHSDEVEDQNGKTLDEKTLPTTDQGTIWQSPNVTVLANLQMCTSDGLWQV